MLKVIAVQKAEKSLRYVSSFTDNRGIRRYRFRKTGHATRYFQAPPGTVEFDAQYRAFLHGETIKPKRRRLEKGEGIYFISAGPSRIKIGWTSDIARRMKELQIGAAPRLALLAFVPGTKAEEAGLHQRFAHLHVRGEWFRATSELTEAIRAISDNRLSSDQKRERHSILKNTAKL